MLGNQPQKANTSEILLVCKHDLKVWKKHNTDLETDRGAAVGTIEDNYTHTRPNAIQLERRLKKHATPKFKTLAYVTCFMGELDDHWPEGLGGILKSYEQMKVEQSEDFFGKIEEHVPQSWTKSTWHKAFRH